MGPKTTLSFFNIHDNVHSRLRLGNRSDQTQVDPCKPRSVTYRSRSYGSRLPMHGSGTDLGHGLALTCETHRSVGQTCGTMGH